MDSIGYRYESRKNLRVVLKIVLSIFFTYIHGRYLINILKLMKFNEIYSYLKSLIR
jgi:hypothetical protein